MSNTSSNHHILRADCPRPCIKHFKAVNLSLNMAKLQDRLLKWMYHLDQVQNE